MLSFLFQNLLKNTRTHSLKSPQPLFILNNRCFSGSEITEKQKQSVSTLLQTYGFTQTQISTLIKKRSLLLSNETLKPKLDFFTCIGFSASDLHQILTVDQTVIDCILDYQIIPSCKVLKSFLDDECVIAAIKRSTWVLKHDLEENLVPNTGVLRSHGVPESRVSAFVRNHPRVLIRNRPEEFKEVVEMIKEIGFEPVRGHFLPAVAALSRLSWDRKWDFYRKWGLTDYEILAAFRKEPTFMEFSEQRLRRKMDFLVNDMGWNASDIASCPTVVKHSLENWIMPRCLVIQFLLSMGAVIKKDMSLNAVIVPKEKFLERFVNQYCVEFPQVLNLYERPGATLQNL